MLNNNTKTLTKSEAPSLPEFDRLFSIAFPFVPSIIKTQIFDGLALAIKIAMNTSLSSSYKRAADLKVINEIVNDYDLEKMFEDIKKNKVPVIKKSFIDNLAAKHVLAPHRRMLRFFWWETVSEETRQLINTLNLIDDSPKGDEIRGLIVAYFMVEPSIRNLGLGFCKELWQSSVALDANYFMQYSKFQNTAAETPRLLPSAGG